MRAALGEIADTRDTDGYGFGGRGSCLQARTPAAAGAAWPRLKVVSTFIGHTGQVSVPPLRLNTLVPAPLAMELTDNAAIEIEGQLPPLAPESACCSSVPPFWVSGAGVADDFVVGRIGVPLASVKLLLFRGAVRRIADPEVIHIDRAAQTFQRAAVDIERCRR